MFSIEPTTYVVRTAKMQRHCQCHLVRNPVRLSAGRDQDSLEPFNSSTANKNKIEGTQSIIGGVIDGNPRDIVARCLMDGVDAVSTSADLASVASVS
jgi:hypothetical protein